MKTADIRARLAAVITMEAQARQVAAAFGVDPAQVAWQPRFDLVLWDLARHLEGKQDLAARLDAAIADVTTAAARPSAELARRVARTHANPEAT